MFSICSKMTDRAPLRLALLAAACGAVAAASAGPGEVLPGPVSARVLAAVDGDTLDVAARVWLGQEVRIRVRLHGVDAPELRGRCAAERSAAIAARDLLARLADGPLHLEDVRYDKFGGRIRARVLDREGRDLAALMLAAGLVRRYDGGRRAGWCPGAG